MKRSMGVSKLQKQLNSVIFDVENSNAEVIITKKGKPIAVIVSTQTFNELKSPNVDSAPTIRDLELNKELAYKGLSKSDEEEPKNEWGFTGPTQLSEGLKEADKQKTNKSKGKDAR